MREQIIELIIQTAKDLGSDQIGTADDLSEETILFGKNGVLDSMGLVTLVIAVEQEIEDRYEVSTALADEKAMSQAHSPYRTVGTLADYAVAQMDNG
ncbi:MAG: acyl carrier protein [Gammaproteobacteria bacterium]|nr:acyl carrier protein [Gammaproteobacteria bacterium]MDH5261583.1 acyl carrier protein [Gammaproteobacteria bacterium]